MANIQVQVKVKKNTQKQECTTFHFLASILHPPRRLCSHHRCLHQFPSNMAQNKGTSKIVFPVLFQTLQDGPELELKDCFLLLTNIRLAIKLRRIP